MTNEQKNKVERYLRQNEGAVSFVWGEDSVTAFDVMHHTIDDYMIDIDEGSISYTPVSNHNVTINIE